MASGRDQDLQLLREIVNALTNSGSLPYGADYMIQSNADGLGNYQTITYKKGGATGRTVKVVTLTFDANSKILTHSEA
jgi:uncharacterized RmlC-like cupin family protein